jgi:hypothetical protein
MNVFAPDMLNTLLEMHKLHLIEPDQVSQFASVQIGPGLYATEIVAEKLARNPSYSKWCKIIARSKSWAGVTHDFESATEKAQQLMRRVNG